MNLKRKTLITGAALAVAALGGSGLAMAAQSSTPAPSQTGAAMSSLATQAVDQAAEGPENAADDGANQGPDANPAEPGHQDATDIGDNEGPENSADDGVNEGPEDPSDDAPAAQ